MNERVLVVEDNAFNLEMLSDWLTLLSQGREPGRVVAASCGGGTNTITSQSPHIRVLMALTASSVNQANDPLSLIGL